LAPSSQSLRTGHNSFSAAWLVVPLGFVCAFIVPFFFHLNGPPVLSAAYVAGASNKAAIVSLALLSLAVAVWAAFSRRTSMAQPETAPQLSRSSILVGAAIVALWTATLGALIVHANIRYGESTYFLERTRDVAQYGLHLYRDLEFPYGPLLLLPPVWLTKVVGAAHLAGCFFAWLTLLNAGGVLLTAYVLDRLPLDRTSRRVLFVIFCFEQLHPLLGPNYSLGKFMLPFAVLLWGSARRTPVRQALAFALGELLVLLVSPELGVGLSAAIIGWSLLTAWLERTPTGRRNPLTMLSALAPIAAYVAFFALYGRGFLDRLGHASAGALNLVIEPLPDMLIFLAAVAWLAPRVVGSSFHWRGNQQTAPLVNTPSQPALLTGIFLLSLGLLPGALGRSDPLHVFFNGFGFLLLSLIAIERLTRHLRCIWIALLLVLAVQVQATNFKIYVGPLRGLASAARHPATPDFDVAALASATHGQPVATPALFLLPQADELALRRANLFVPDRFAGFADIWDAAAEQSKIDSMRRCNFALAPTAPFTTTEGLPNDDRGKLLFRFGYRYPQRNAPLFTGAMVEQELALHWTPIGRFGTQTLYRRIS
jgi:hypothetical protein